MQNGHTCITIRALCVCHTHGWQDADGIVMPQVGGGDAALPQPCRAPRHRARRAHAHGLLQGPGQLRALLQGVRATATNFDVPCMSSATAISRPTQPECCLHFSCNAAVYAAVLHKGVGRRLLNEDCCCTTIERLKSQPSLIMPHNENVTNLTCIM